MMALVTSLLSACLVVWSIEQARHMTRKTCHRIRIGVVLIGASAIASALSPLYGTAPAWVLPAFMAGVSAFLWADRRIA